MRALLIDDDEELRAMMREFFGQCGYALETAPDGRSGLDRVLAGDHEIVLLDVMLPAINGFSVLQQIRRVRRVPVIMLTARTHRDDRIAGLNAGADDYVAKPFDPEELLARMGAVLRRAAQPLPGASRRRFGPLDIDICAREVQLAGRKVALTGLEFDMLEMLTRRPGQPVSRDDISRALLGRATSPYDRALDVHVSHLRDKLKARQLIRAVRGVGYVFAGEQEK